MMVISAIRLQSYEKMSEEQNKLPLFLSKLLAWPVNMGMNRTAQPIVMGLCG